ncbi:MAG: hypothetical protein K6B43_08090 [Treponema sp.]|nr:hypothetical protein [Treponema sp.]
MRKIFSFVLFFVISIAFSAAELVSSQKFGYTIDLPEGFVMVDGSEDESMFQFSSEIVPVTVLLVTSSSQKSKNPAEEFLKSNLKKLGATLKGSRIDNVSWRRRKASVASFVFQNQVFSEEQQGISACVQLSSANSFVNMIVFTPKKNFYQNECFVSSIIDSLSVDLGSFKEPGIITQQKYFSDPLDKKSRVNVDIEIAGQKISTSIGNKDVLANQSVIDREFNVFKVYAMSGDESVRKFAVPAWQRFYRMIARDALYRMKIPAFDISAALQDVAFEKDPSNTDAAIAQMLLNWVQSFEYRRESQDVSKADFNNIPSVMQNLGSDCDSRSMLVAVILKNLGVDSCFFVSSEYSHALVGAVLDGKQGFSFPIDGKQYLLGETTVKGLTFGTIAAEQADISKWVEVEFPF